MEGFFVCKTVYERLGRLQFDRLREVMPRETQPSYRRYRRLALRLEIGETHYGKRTLDYPFGRETKRTN